jgi:hypothetical protein
VSLSGAVFIDRKNRHDAVKSFNQVGQEMKKNGVSASSRQADGHCGAAPDEQGQAAACSEETPGPHKLAALREAP